MNQRSERALQEAVEFLSDLSRRPALNQRVRATLLAEAEHIAGEIEFEKSIEETRERRDVEIEPFQFRMTELLEVVLTVDHIASFEEMRLRSTGTGEGKSEKQEVGDLMRRVSALTAGYLRRRFGKKAPSVQLAYAMHLAQGHRYGEREQ